MNTDREIDRRSFLKLSAAGAVMATVHPQATAESFTETPFPPLQLADLASDRFTHRYRDLFNCPAAMNELGYAQVGKSVSAITAIAFPPYACCGVPETAWSPGYLLTCELFLNGKFLAVASGPEGEVAYRWFPHYVERSQVAEQLCFTTRMFMPAGRRAVAQSVTVKNLSSEPRRFTLSFHMRGAVIKRTKPWFANSPGEPDNRLTWHAQRGALLFEAQHSEVAAAQGFRPAPARMEEQRVLVHEMQLGAGEQKELNFVAAIASTGKEALALHDEIQQRFAELATENEAVFNRLLQAAFTPGNGDFSGNLPRLITNNETLWKLYHNGFANLLFARRVSPDSAYGPTYLTLSGHVLPTLGFPWDTSLSSLALALLDPVPLRTLVEVWIKAGMHDHLATDYVSGEAVGPWYAVNDTAIVRCAWRYVCVTGDVAWLNKQVGDATVQQHLENHALYWKKLDRSGHGLGDYGTIENLLEVVDTYRHEVPGMNANNVQAMRCVAAIQERHGNSARARELRAEADSLANRINRQLYVSGKGYWRCGQPDGTFLEVRHCYDFLTILDSMPEDLSSAQKREMAEFFWRELHTEKWMRALSQSDADATWNIRPDHSCIGAYCAWPAITAKGLYRIESPSKIANWLSQVAKAGNQGPIGQAHFIEDVFPPANGGAFKASNDAPYIEDWSCLAAGAFTELVIDSIFGADLTLSDGIRVTSRLLDLDPNASLLNLPYQGAYYTVNREGVQKQRS